MHMTGEDEDGCTGGDLFIWWVCVSSFRFFWNLDLHIYLRTCDNSLFSDGLVVGETHVGT